MYSLTHPLWLGAACLGLCNQSQWLGCHTCDWHCRYLLKPVERELGYRVSLYGKVHRCTSIIFCAIPKREPANTNNDSDWKRFRTTISLVKSNTLHLTSAALSSTKIHDKHNLKQSHTSGQQLVHTDKHHMDGAAYIMQRDSTRRVRRDICTCCSSMLSC